MEDAEGSGEAVGHEEKGASEGAAAGALCFRLGLLTGDSSAAAKLEFLEEPAEGQPSPWQQGAVLMSPVR